MKEFEEWLKENDKLRDFITLGCGKTCDNFNTFPFSMQWGVYLEFFDSVGIIIKDNVASTHINMFGFGIYLNIEEHGHQFLDYTKDFESRTEAQQEAIKKAFEILENR